MADAMGEIVNLNKARKAKIGAKSKAVAASNRVVHGRTKVERKITEQELARRSRLLDGAKRETDET